jgi:S-adenosylmethionine synthetase
MVETFGTANVDPAAIASLIREHFDLRPGVIIRDLDLRRPIYSRTAAYGHFGRREPGFTWGRPRAPPTSAAQPACSCPTRP